MARAQQLVSRVAEVIADPNDEMAAIARVRAMVGDAPEGEIWSGDDAAVLLPRANRQLFATDVVVEHVHFDRRFCSLADVGWKALAVNVSDIAAMAGSPRVSVVTVVGADPDEMHQLSLGMIEASKTYGCPIVGGDVSAGALLSIGVAIIGECEKSAPVLRSGARAGDAIFVTGPLGRASAGLRALQLDLLARGDHVDAHRRPVARLAEGIAAGRAGASAMIDVSDGFGLDLCRLLDASGTGAELSEIPVAPGATDEDALGGGEDFELLFSAPDPEAIEAGFRSAGLAAPLRIGRIVADPARRRVGETVLDPRGYAHDLYRRGSVTR
jgi:thiamine-monophosphate kinase